MIDPVSEENPGQVGLGSSRPGPARPGQLGRVNWPGIYEGCSKSTRKSAIIFLFCKSAELNNYSYIDRQDLYLYSKICCTDMNTMLTVVAMETVHHDYRPTFGHFCKKSMFNDDVAFDTLPCFFHQTLYEQSSICLR